MRIAHFWAWGHPEEDPQFLVRGWSDRSVSDAAVAARERAETLFNRFKTGILEKQRYPYGDRVLPEPILSEITDGAGKVSALVTRNSYGARILNTAQLMFVDIDLTEDDRSKGPGFFSKLFKQSASASELDLDEPVRRVEEIINRERIAAARIYRTKNGLRIMILSEAFDPGSTASENLLKSFGADEKYRRLCRLQVSYRARLTPKPWRCGAQELRMQYPLRSEKESARFARWESEYAALSSKFRTCRLITSSGTVSLSSEFQSIVDLHDTETRIAQELPLA